MVTPMGKDQQIQLSIEQIPELSEPMPVMKLGDPISPPDELIKGIVATISPKAEFKPLGGSGIRAAFEANRLVAFQNSKTGETRIFPSLEALKPGKGLAERARAIAAKFAADPSLFPQDRTRAVPLPPVTLASAKQSRDVLQRPVSSEHLSYIRFQREIDGVPVYGPGTRAMIAVAADDSIHAFAYRWRKAGPAVEKVVPHSRNEIAKAILAQLASSAKGSRVRVDRVSIGYYDGGKSFLQPVYRFVATITSAGSESNQSDAHGHVLGYVSIGDALEALPVLGVLRGKSPAEPPYLPQNIRSAPPDDPSVGRYVVRNDADEWVDSANDFWDSLEFGNSFFPIRFTNSEYYWAHDRFYLSDKDSFVNSVHIALTEGHGNWGKFSTWKTGDDNPATPGESDNVFLDKLSDYGSRSGDSLAYWIIHSCEVVPTRYDEQLRPHDVWDSFAVWWNIFNGLHAVVAYRTDMYIDDDVTGSFGIAIRLGAPVVSAWLNEVASNDSYGDDDDTYHDDNLRMDEPKGRASAVVVSGHSDDTLNDLSPLGRPSSLTQWWLEN